MHTLRIRIEQLCQAPGSEFSTCRVLSRSRYYSEKDPNWSQSQIVPSELLEWRGLRTKFSVFILSNKSPESGIMHYKSLGRAAVLT